MLEAEKKLLIWLQMSARQEPRPNPIRGVGRPRTTTSAILLLAAGCFLLLARPALTSSSAPYPPLVDLEPSSVRPDPNATPSSSSSSSGANVILIKYANVSKPEHELDKPNGLTAYRLFNEPLTVSVIESKFSTLIQSFDVSANQLSTLAKDLFCPLSNDVRQLNISHNLLENFDSLGLISQNGQLCLSDLKLLDMSYNLIKHLPATGVATLHNLEVLDLSHNLIESLDELSLSSLFKLTKLDLSANRIQHLPVRIFHKSTSMKFLNLKFNYLQTTINQMLLSGLVSLEDLNLSFNNITHITDSPFLDKINLTKVDLRHNHLTGLRQEALRVTTSTSAQLTGRLNPYQSNAPPTATTTSATTTTTTSATTTVPTTTTSSSSSSSSSTVRHRLHHNGQYVSTPSVSSTFQRATTQQNGIATDFFISQNPFICDCQLDWLRRYHQTHSLRRSMMTKSNRMNTMDSDQFNHQFASGNSLTANSFYQNNDQPPVISSSSPESSLSPAAAAAAAAAGAATATTTTTNNISEILSSSNGDNLQQNGGTNSKYSNVGPYSVNSNGQQIQQHYYGRIGDLDFIKCSPLFKRNSQRSHQHNNQHQHQRISTQITSSHLHSVPRGSAAPSDDNIHQNFDQQTAMALLHRQHTFDNLAMIDLLTADSSNFLCRYKSHCFALCHCCEFDACDCEFICPNGCNCYYDLTWQTNIIDCSSMNHTVVPDRIPMDVSGLYLDGNNIESLKPSNLIARNKLKNLYLNGTQLHSIANRTFNGLIELQTLHLNDNVLKTLNGYEFEPLAKLRALYLQSNRLDHINNQTFIYLRSLEVLDLSDNRLTSINLDIFWSIGHHNIRLRQLSIAHNWWSCQCNSINRFRHILKQKFLSNGNSVVIADKNQLRCYYNSTTVGPLILASGASVPGELSMAAGFMQPLLATLTGSSKQLPSIQHQLTEINQCSDMIEDRLEMGDLNPPLIQAIPDYTPAPPAANDYSNDPFLSQDPNTNNNQPQTLDQSIYTPPNLIMQMDNANQNNILANSPLGINPSIGVTSTGQRLDSSRSSMPLTSFILLSILLAGVTVIGVSIFVFVRQQKQRYHQKKSSAASTTSASSTASSTAVSSMNGKSVGRPTVGGHHPHVRHHLLHNATSGIGNSATQHHHHHHHHHLIMSNGSAGGATTTSINHHHLHHQPPPSSMVSGTTPVSLHHHSASSQSNIYAALVSPSTANSTTLTSAATGQNNALGNSNNNRNIIQQNNNLYSNSSSHHSSLSHGNYPAPMNPVQAWPANAMRNQQPVYGTTQSNTYGLGSGPAENPYAVSGLHGGGGLHHHHQQHHSTYKAPSTGSAFYSGSMCQEQRASVEQHQREQRNDWIKLPKVKQFMSKLVNKSLAFSGYRTCSRDELSAITSDKIYDAFISYDKRDEAFVLQHLSAELEYGQPQYRIADRYRDLPLSSSAYMAEAITSLIGCSHRTVVVLSSHYLASEWCRFELRAALGEAALDRAHKLIAVVLEPACLRELDADLQALLSSGHAPHQLVQVEPAGEQQLVATLTGAGGQQQVSTQAAGQAASSRLTLLHYSERKFWARLRALMPSARHQSLTLTTNN